jgi:uncharacterized membrane protein
MLAAVIWVGGAFTLQVLLFKATRAGDLARSAALGQDAAYVGQRVFFHASVAILFFGIWMVVDQPAWAFGQTWIVIGLAVSILSAAVGMAYFGPESQRLGTMAAERGLNDTEVQSRLKRLTLISRIELLLLFLVVADMVAKPGV